MKIIRITTGNEVSTHDFPEGTYQEQNEVLRELIGPRCELYEHVKTERLSRISGFGTLGHLDGVTVSMLVDEEGLYHDLEVNAVGSWLYGTDRHGHPIMGDVLIVGESFGEDGMDFCGMPDWQFYILLQKLEDLARVAKDQ